MGDLSFKFRGVTIKANKEMVAGMVLAHVNGNDPVPCVAKSSTPALGQIWEGQGGIYAGSYRDENGEIHDLISAADDLNSEWAWGEYGKTIEGADSKSDGLANTIAMAKNGSKLAKAALEYVADGHEDFRLPAQNELALCFINISEHFKKEAYWSSTQYSADYARCQGFYGGGQLTSGKSAALRARAVRRVIK